VGRDRHQACPSLPLVVEQRPNFPWPPGSRSLLVPAATIRPTPGAFGADDLKSITTGRSLIARAWLITSSTSSGALTTQSDAAERLGQFDEGRVIRRL